jgi:uncharacterized protein (UPF0248 family)
MSMTARNYEINSLVRMGTTAVAEFESLLSDSRISYKNFVERHGRTTKEGDLSTIQEVLLHYSISEKDAHLTEFNYITVDSVFGGKYHESLWLFDGRLERHSGDAKTNARWLGCLFDEIYKLEFLKQPDRYRAARDAMRETWWHALVVPELQRLGIKIHYSGKDRGKGRNRPADAIISVEERKQYFLSLQKRKMPRHQVVQLCSNKFGVKSRQASKMIASFGLLGKAGRPSSR